MLCCFVSSPPQSHTHTRYPSQCCATIACAEKSPYWWVVMSSSVALWLFMVIYDLFGPGINSSIVLINLGTCEDILPSMGRAMTAQLDTTVEDWLEP